MEPYKSLLKGPGTRFVVKEKVPGVYEGTTAFLSHYKGKAKNDNIMRVAAVCVKKGKTGKPRVENIEVLVPVFSFKKKSFKDLMPKGIKYLIEPDWDDSPVSVFGFNSIDFAGWGAARASLLRLICIRGGTGPFGGGGGWHPHNKQNNVWPGNDPFLNGLYRARTRLNHVGLEAFEQEMADEAFRAGAVVALRRLESNMVRRILVYSSKIAEYERQAAHWLRLHAEAGHLKGISAKRLELTERKAAEKEVRLNHLIDQKAKAVKQNHQFFA